jgi:hypothetical protein
MEPLVVQPQPASDLPGDVAPQRAGRFPAAQALQRLQHQDAGDYLGWDRWVAPTLTGQIRERLGREQLVAVVGKKAIPRPVGDQVAAPDGRVHLSSEAWHAGLMSPAVCPLPARSANHRIGPISQIDNKDGTTPNQPAPRRLVVSFCHEAGTG